MIKMVIFDPNIFSSLELNPPSIDQLFFNAIAFKFLSLSYILRI